MPTPHFEVPIGAINDSNLVFTLSRGYQPNTTAVFINGVLMRRDLDDGWLETASASGVVTLKVAPSTGDIVQIFFTDLEQDVGNELTFLAGSIEDSPEITAAFTDDEIFASVIG